MKRVNLYNIRLNQMQIFLTAAECNNFTDAAEYLHLTQPMISKTIKILEQELNIILFIREHGKLKLTPAGRELYNRWSNIVGYIENSLDAANAIQEGKVKRVIIGIAAMSDDNAIVNSLEQLSEKTDSDLVIEKNIMSVLLENLKDDKIDILVTSKHQLPAIERNKYKWKTILKTNLAVYIPKANPLSQKRSISFKDLKSEKFIALSEKTDSEYLALLDHLAAEAGFVPQISCFVDNEFSFSTNLRLNKGIVMADSITMLAGEHVKRFILKEYENDVVIAWKNDNYSGQLKQFVDAL